MKKLTLYLIYPILAAFAFGCQKQGYMPPPEGEKVPYQDTLESKITLREELAKSAATHFYAAWQRSNMDAIIKAQTMGKTNFTLLVPSNAALESAGYTLPVIEAMEQKNLDSLLMFYTLRNRITYQNLAQNADNVIGASLLEIPAFYRARTVGDGNGRIYNYRQQIKIQDGAMYANGKVVGTGKGAIAKDGQIWFLDQAIPRPVKTMWEVIENDTRFSMLFQLLNYTDAQWNQILKAAAPFEQPRPAFYKRWGITPLGNTNTFNVTELTLLLPTNEAFKAAGFNSLQDLIDLNTRRGLPYYGRLGDLGMRMIGNFATDTLLAYHMNWGRMLHVPSSQQGISTAFSTAIFYSNVMNNAVLGNYLITGSIYYGDNDGPQNDVEYYMPLDFSKEGNAIKVKVKASEAPAGTVVQADIPSLNGPINLVDRILVPKGFSTTR